MSKSNMKIAGADIKKLPTELQKELKVGERSGKRSRIIRLIENAPEEGYSLNELLVLYYQRWNDIMKRGSLQGHVNALVKSGEAVRTGPGRVKAANDSQ